MNECVTMELPVKLSQDEVLRYVSDLRDYLSLKLEIEQNIENMKTELRGLKRELADNQVMMDKINNRLRDGCEERDVKCEIRMNDPESGKKTTYRLDTNEVVFTVDMTGEEKDDLFNQETEEVSDGVEEKKVVYLKRKEEETVCKYCGAIDTRIPGNRIYHISGDVPICAECLWKRNGKNQDTVNKWSQEGYQVLFRPQFGFGCTEEKHDLTCFRFMRTGHSWGCPVYVPGHYENAESEAGKYYAELKRKENWKED